MAAYPHEITVVCPDSLRANGNHAVAAFGLQVADLNTLGEPQFEKGATQYRVTNSRATQACYDLLVDPPPAFEVPRPSWDGDNLINLTAARGIYNGRVVVVAGEVSELATALSTNKMLIVFNIPLATVIAETGLVRLSQGV